MNPVNYSAKDNGERQFVLKPVIQDAGGPLPAELPDPLTKALIVCTADYVFVRQGYRYVRLGPSDVLFLQAAGNYTDIITYGPKYTLRLVLGKVLDQFAPSDLIRVHRCYAVNRQRVDSLADGNVCLGPHTVPVGRSYRDALLSHFRRL